MDSFRNKTSQREPSYKLKYIFCNSPHCPDCSKGKGHGPYWHAIYHFQGKEHTVFLGKDFKPFDLHQNQTNEDRHQKTTSTASEKKPFQQTFKATPRPSQPQNNQTINSWKGISSQTQRSGTINSPPTRLDFERDLRTLKSTYQPNNLKSLYRQLTKKYHPDRYPGITHINAWMAEINGQYHELKKAAGL